MRWLAVLLLVSACSATEPQAFDGPPEAGRCDLVDNVCVHSGDPSTRCLEWAGTTFDPSCACVLNLHKIFYCELVAADHRGDCTDAFRCVQDPMADGGLAYAFLSCEYIAPPSPLGCDPALAEQLAEQWSEPGGLPDCADLDAGPAPLDADLDAGATEIDAGPTRPGRCELVDNACVHSGGLPDTCCERYGISVEPERLCALDQHKVYACVLSQGGCGYAPAGACYQLPSDDGGIAEYVLAPYTWGSAGGPPCNTSAENTLIGEWSGPGIPGCDTLPADAGPSRCDLVDGGCVHSGDTSTSCVPQYATFIDVWRVCYLPSGPYACAVSRPHGCNLDVHSYAVCDGDGGLTEIIERDDCVLIPPVANYCTAPIPMDDIDEALSTPGDHTCPPFDAGPGRCDLVNGACVHSGDPSTGCVAQNGWAVDPVRLCRVDGFMPYACALSRPGASCGTTVDCFTARDADGGVAAYVEADDCNSVLPSREACDPAVYDHLDEAERLDVLPSCSDLDAGMP